MVWSVVTLYVCGHIRLHQQEAQLMQGGRAMAFLRSAAHIFVSPGDAPATITQYVARIERQFNACQTPSQQVPIYLQ